MCQLATTLRRDVGVTSYKIWEGTKTTAMMKNLIRMKCPNQHPWVRPERKNHDVSLARRSRVATVADTTLLDGGWLHAIFRLWFHLQPRSIHSHSEWQCLMSIYVNQHILIILFILHLIHELIAICFNWFLSQLYQLWICHMSSSDIMASSSFNSVAQVLQSEPSAWSVGTACEKPCAEGFWLNSTWIHFPCFMLYAASFGCWNQLKCVPRWHGIDGMAWLLYIELCEALAQKPNMPGMWSRRWSSWSQGSKGLFGAVHSVQPGLNSYR